MGRTIITALIVFGLTACSSRNDGFNYGHQAVKFCEVNRC